MDKLMLMNDQPNAVVWGKYVIFFLLSTGFWLMLRTRFLPFAHAQLILRKILGSLGKGDKGDGVTPFQAVAATLAGTLGAGSVVGVTTALTMGRPGVLLWMYVSTILDMMTKHAEVVLAIHYRTRERDGTFIDGPMTTLESDCYMGFLGVLFAVLCIFASFGIGNITPASTIAHTIIPYTSILSWSIGLIMALFIAQIIFGKGNLVMRFNETTTPVISVLYITACLYLIVLHADALLQALRLIWYDAMRLVAGVGGIGSLAISRAMHFGISRGVFSDKVRVGSSLISHACISHANTVEQRFWEIFGAFFDMIVACTITGLMILISRLLDSGMEGVALTVVCFTSGFDHLGGIIFSFSIVAFVTPSTLGWYYYARECSRYLFKGKLVLYIYQGVFLVLPVFGAQLQLTFVWDVTDMLNRLMAIPNLTSLATLCRVVVKSAEEYLGERGSDQMKVVVACDFHKGCMTSKEVAERIELGIRQVDDAVITTSYVIGSGGEGAVEAFHETRHGRRQPAGTTDTYGRKIISEYTIIRNGETVVIEVANIIGLNMHRWDKRVPFFGSSYGIDTVTLDVAAQGYRKIITGLDGSATSDGGMGPLQALGCRFYDSSHKYLSPQVMSLGKVRYIDSNRLNKLESIELIAACGVKNRLLGENGATYALGKQKSFFSNRTHKINLGMENLCNQVWRYLHVDIDSFDGKEAAGGIGVVLIGILHVNMIFGIELLPSFSDMEEQMKGCDLVITGEGQSDRQTMLGKVPVGILKVANCRHKPCICTSGALGIGYQELHGLGFIGAYSIADRAMIFRQALDNAPNKLTATTYGTMETVMYYMNRANGDRG